MAAVAEEATDSGVIGFFSAIDFTALETTDSSGPLENSLEPCMNRIEVALKPVSRGVYVDASLMIWNGRIDECLSLARRKIVDMPRSRPIPGQNAPSIECAYKDPVKWRTLRFELY